MLKDPVDILRKLTYVLEDVDDLQDEKFSTYESKEKYNDFRITLALAVTKCDEWFREEMHDGHGNKRGD